MTTETETATTPTFQPATIYRNTPSQKPAGRAVRLTDDVDWEAAAAWAGGEVRVAVRASDNREVDVVLLRSGEMATDGEWIVQLGRDTFLAWDDADFHRWFLLRQVGR